MLSTARRSVKDLNTNVKMMALLLAALVIGGVAYAAFAEPDYNQIAPQAGPEAQAARKNIAQRHWLLARWLLTKGEPATLQGTVVTHTPGITVLQVSDRDLNVLTPARWLANGQVESGAELMEGLKTKTVTMEILKVEYNGGVKTTIYAVYRVTYDGGVAEAILPVNISPTSTSR
jgi:hypothetical protein